MLSLEATVQHGNRSKPIPHPRLQLKMLSIYILRIYYYSFWSGLLIAIHTADWLRELIINIYIYIYIFSKWMYFFLDIVLGENSNSVSSLLLLLYFTDKFFVKC